MGKKTAKKSGKEVGLYQDGILTEVAWEVCNQVGGIYTVIRSKVPAMIDKWGDNYAVIGPYVDPNVSADFEDILEYDSPFGVAVLKMRAMGFEVHYGRWLVSGRPQAILLNPYSVFDKLGDIKYNFWENHHIDFKNHDPLMDQVLAFGYLVKIFISELTRECISNDKKLISHFHEWMGGACIPDLRREQIPVKSVFTTHATMLGRYLAMNDPQFYDHLPFIDWEKEANHFNIEAIVKLERACAHGSHVFTTVSEVTGRECIHLIGRSPDNILPNGLNIERFSVVHEVQNLHHQFKNKIEQFIMGHFFQSYSFDLKNTLYFFTSGRFEYRNKGYDLALEALARLNHRMKQEDVPVTVVMFIITRQPTHSINPGALNSRAMLKEIESNCDAILEQIKGRLINHAASYNLDHRLPSLNDFVDDYWRLRYRRTIQSWKSSYLPSVVTHNLVNDAQDEVLNFLRSSNLVNNADDKVKVVYHPDFISSTNPLFGMEYSDFVRGCHLGVFPSYYEPWGYTPIECLASGVSAVTSDLSGFGDYAANVPEANEEHGLYIVERANKDFNSSANHLADLMFKFVKSSSRRRIESRNKSEDLSEQFDWKNLYVHYENSYLAALNEISIPT